MNADRLAHSKIVTHMGGFEHKASSHFPVFIPEFAASMKKVTVGEVKDGITTELITKPINWKKII